ncbi:MAG: hypothetical protein COB01_10595 [Lutibacter sp.]|nr:MAG: hypothetical protein COB01_10595 [Lutibacter sp.]
MEKYTSTSIYAFKIFIPAIILGVFLLNKNMCTYETSILASFLFFTPIQLFFKIYNPNILYNFSHNKTLHK